MSTILKELNDFSLQIKETIEASDWERLSMILISRQKRLETLLNSPLSDDEQRIMKDALESVQVMDKLFVDAVQSKKTELLKEFQTVALGQKGIKAYYASSMN